MNKTIINQDGSQSHMSDIQHAHAVEDSKFNNELLESKRGEFEAALAKRCEEKNEIFNKMGFQPSIGVETYQVGMGVFALFADNNGISGRQVGNMG